MSFQLRIVCGHFCATKAELRSLGLQSLKYFLSVLLQKKCADLWQRVQVVEPGLKQCQCLRMLFILLISFFPIPSPNLPQYSTCGSFSEYWSVDWGCSEVCAIHVRKKSSSHGPSLLPSLPQIFFECLLCAKPSSGAGDTPVGRKSWCFLSRSSGEEGGQKWWNRVIYLLRICKLFSRSGMWIWEGTWEKWVKLEKYRKQRSLGP